MNWSYVKSFPSDVKRGDVCVIRRVCSGGYNTTQQVLAVKANDNLTYYSTLSALKIEPQSDYKEWRGCFSYIGG